MEDVVPDLMKRVSAKLIAIVFVPIFLCLAAAYYVFLRPDYVPVFTALRAQQAASIAKVLSSRNIVFRLVSDGSVIEVPSDKAGEARLAIAGSDVNPGATTGFELFNKSDMGLTDFAQKINYQRALQGELERTILSIDGIETARVHLALPEKSLFRSVRSSAKASIQIGTRSDVPLDPAHVASLQHLVASAVPDLEPGAVTVVDERGSLLSAVESEDPDGLVSADVEERRAVQHILRARLRRAILNVFPELQFDIKVLALSSTVSQPVETGGGAARGFPVRMTFLTPEALVPDQQARIEEIARSAVAYTPANGDVIAFETGALTSPAMPSVVPGAPITVAPTSSEPQQRNAPSAVYPILAAAACLLALSLIWWLLRPTIGKSTSASNYHAELADRIRTALRPAGDSVRGD